MCSYFLELMLHNYFFELTVFQSKIERLSQGKLIFLQVKTQPDQMEYLTKANYWVVCLPYPQMLYRQDKSLPGRNTLAYFFPFAPLTQVANNQQYLYSFIDLNKALVVSIDIPFPRLRMKLKKI